jgi:guanylate kinase
LARGLAFILSAPSGAGKTTLVRRLRKEVEGLGFSVSHTTREPRQGEVEGLHYHFTTRPEFEALREASAFAEWAEVHGNLYGTSYRALEACLSGGLDLLLDIDVQGALQLRNRLEEAVFVFLLPPNWQALRERLERRGLDSPEVIERRIQNAREEMAHAGSYDYLVVNDSLERATRELASIVTAERCRGARRRKLLEELR